MARWLICVVLAGCAATPRGAAGELPCTDDAPWAQPIAPRKVFGTTWFVGTCAIAAILVTSDDGHVLIDAGPLTAGAQVLANIEKLGFRKHDVRSIVISHEHADHVAGLAEVQSATGATVFALRPAAVTLEAGQSSRSDPQFLVTPTFPPVSGVQRIEDGAVIGGLTAHATPVHTPGSTTWTWTSCEGERCLQFVYADSMTPISDDVYRFSDAPIEPLRAALDRIAALPCDVLLTPHPSASQFWQRLNAGGLVDANACRAYALRGHAKLSERLARERRSADGAQQPGDGR